MKRCKWLFLLIAVMLLVGCSGASKDKVTKAEGQTDCKAMSEEFYADLIKADPIKMTTSMNGEVVQTITKDGDAIQIEDTTQKFYLFKENGKNYYMTDEGKPMNEDVMYDMYANMVNMNLTLFVTGYYEVEDADGLEFASTRTDKADGTASELVSTIKGKAETGEEIEMTTTGTKENGKVTKVAVQWDAAGTKYDYLFEYDYDVKVTLPEHEIKDMSQYYHHVDSPYATIDDALMSFEDEAEMYYVIYGEQILAFVEADGRQLQLTAPISDADYAEYQDLDFFADDYQEKSLEIIRKQAVTDCIDYTDALIPQEELDAFVGKKCADVVAAGFENSGWSIFGEEGGNAVFAKDGFEYEADIVMPEGFDFEGDHDFESLIDCEITGMRFSGVTVENLPLQ